MAVKRALPWLAVVGPLIAWASPTEGRMRLDHLLTSPDLLAPAALYQDVAHDGRPRAGFQFSAATFAVPDAATYFAARWAAGNHPAALPLWSAGQFLVLAVAGWWAARSFAAGRVWAGGMAAYLAGLVVGGFAGSDLDFVLPVWHTGALAATFAGLAVLRRLVAAHRPIGWGLILAGLVAVGVFSDRLIGLYLVGPAVVWLALGWRAGRVAGHPAGVGLVALVGGAVVGLVALRAILGADDPIGNYWHAPDPTRLTARAVRLLTIAVGEVAAGNRLLLGAALWYLVAATRVAGPSAMLRSVSGLALAGVTAAFLLGRGADDMLAAGDWRVFGRYFVGPIGLAYLGWAVWLAEARRPWLAAALAVGWVAGTPLGGWPAFDSYPDRVRAVDEACLARGLTAGLGGYADGKPCTLLSRAGVTVRQARPEAELPCGLTAFPWLAHRDGYRPGPAGFQFVLVGHDPEALPEAGVVARLGEPAERVPVGDRTLLVYDRPADWRLARFADADVRQLNASHERTGAAVTYPGAALFSAAAGVQDTPDLAKVAEEGATPAGLATQGPYVRVVRAGRYRATVRLTATAPGSTVEAVWVRADGTLGRVLATAAVPDGTHELPLDFTLNQHRLGGLLEFRLRFGGSGRLTVQTVRFERVGRETSPDRPRPKAGRYESHARSGEG